MPFEIIRQDITKVKADCIVNTANPKPTVGAGTDYAIYTAAGLQKLLAARKEIGTILPGECRETPAFGLNAKYLIHTVGPVWIDGDHGEFDALRSCYRSSLELAEQLGCESIVFPLISAGTYGFPKDRALQTAMSVIQPYVMEHDMKVTLAVFGDEAFRLSGKVVEQVRAYVDSFYVEEAEEREYSMPMPMMNAECVREELPTERRRSLFRRNTAPKASAPKKQLPDESFAAKQKTEPKTAPVWESVSIEELLKNPEKTFQEKLFEIIDERGLTGPQVYKNYISKQVYSKIQSDPHYHPNKFTAIALCLSLRLDLEQTLDLMGRAGWTLSTSSKADLVVRGCILNREYNICNIDLILFDYHLPTLDKIK